jgi:hypothetical protein
MKSKITFSSAHRLLVSICFVITLGLFATTAQAQLATDVIGRDSLTGKIPHLKRAEFLAMSLNDQEAFLEAPPFVITDLVNSHASDMLTGTPGIFYLSTYKFYKLIPPSEELQVLRRPEMYKVYQ